MTDKVINDLYCLIEGLSLYCPRDIKLLSISPLFTYYSN